MSYIPDIKYPYDPMSDNFGKFKMNYYYEGLLTTYGKELLSAYDLAITDMLTMLNFCLDEEALGEYVEPENELEEENVRITVETLADEVVNGCFSDMLLDHMLMQRNERFVALLDSDENNEFYDKAKIEQMEEDFAKLSKREILKKYPVFEFDEMGEKHERFEEGNQAHSV